jgi:glyoxylase-like metal-dependent hydrolase (beta-lactamase superfamily II)
VFSAKRISDHLQRIVDPLGVALYLCEGTERAALIDTGYGVRGLRAYVETLTSKPITILLTHGHVDHAPGAFEWGEAHLNERDLPTLEAHADMAYRIRLARMVNQELGITEESLVPRGDFQTLPLEDGASFELGGVTVEAYAIPGHTRGSMVMLVPEDRIAIFGDAIGPGTLLLEDFSAPISEYLEAMRSFKAAHEGRYDLVLRNHGTCESTSTVLDDVIEAAERILAGTDAKVELPGTAPDILPLGNPQRIACYSACVLAASESGMVRADGREGNINYREDKAC